MHEEEGVIVIAAVDTADEDAVWMLRSSIPARLGGPDWERENNPGIVCATVARTQ
jgi:hypothetical protein